MYESYIYISYIHFWFCKTMNSIWLAHAKWGAIDVLKELKGPFSDPQPHPPHFSPKQLRCFTHIEAFRYVTFVCKIFRANSFVWQNNGRIIDLCMLSTSNIEVYATVNHAHKFNIRVNRHLSLFFVSPLIHVTKIAKDQEMDFLIQFIRK